MIKKIALSVVLLLFALTPIYFTVKENNQYNDMVNYYETDYTLDYLDNAEFVVGTIRTKRNDINYWTYLVEIHDFKGADDIYIHIEQEFDYDIDILMIYENNKIVYIKQINMEEK